MKKLLVNLFQIRDRRIKCYTLEDLKDGIKENTLIIFQYRYTNKFYKSYPNSFDPLPLKDNQKALILINRLTHNDYYEWNKYWYDKDKNGYLFSLFRKNILGWEKKSFQSPTTANITDYINEAENESRNYQSEKCKVHYINGSYSTFCTYERALYKVNKLNYIAELKDLPVAEELSIQMLDEIIENTKLLISKKGEEKTKEETPIRKDPKYKLSDSEINSPVELWKILLKKAVTDHGEENVYEAVFASIPKQERITLNTFNHWHDLEKDMILPRSRRDQKALLGYLGFDTLSPYFRIMIIKKITNIKNSRSLNVEIERLLRKILTETIDERKFNSLSESNSELFDLLDINKLSDLNTFIDLLEISLTPIERIEYDKN